MFSFTSLPGLNARLFGRSVPEYTRMKNRCPFGCHAALNTSPANGSFGSGLRASAFVGSFGFAPVTAGRSAGPGR